jgi:hypothetical protein
LDRVAHWRGSTRGARGPRPSGAGSRKCNAAKASVSVRKKLARKAIARRARGFLLYQRAAAWLFEDVLTCVRVILASGEESALCSLGALPRSYSPTRARARLCAVRSAPRGPPHLPRLSRSAQCRIESCGADLAACKTLAARRRRDTRTRYSQTPSSTRKIKRTKPYVTSS